ncbi:hypothetical protein C7441_10915 [Pseudaminobacter salicylatoxidans]|uniref:Uncharacterized protein n=1 Tax=Pseudaminobacter salicylatoxidans TaxID=93369 RepID=A0A316CMM5_PSESE|nr:DUF3617 family protein [Pseudaminobacter salicylatoxidans]PWJ82249.1 hypothetical protein C7441_10915 [Pseudaminobacter salicylatoxidans]
MKHPMRPFPILLAACLVLGVSHAAPAFELPVDLPSRSEGLWTVDQSSTLSESTTSFDIRKIWKVCLDAGADRALHELEAREQQSNIASLKEICEEPQASVSGNVLSWSMHCSGPSPSADKTGTSDVRHKTTFVSNEETRAETAVVNQDKRSRSHGQFFTHMKHVGSCEGGLRPGDMMLTNLLVNGEETLKARQLRNIYREIEDQKLFTASRLSR